MDCAVVLFTRDLRIHDHPALYEAVACAGQVVPLFVVDVELAGVSPNRTSFLLDSLHDLRSGLHRLGGELVVRRGDPVDETVRIAREHGAAAVFVSDDVSGFAARRRRRLETGCTRQGIGLETRPGVTIVPPGQLRPSGGDHYRVFTPYWKAWRSTPTRALLPAPDHVAVPASVDAGRIPDLAELVDGERSPELCAGGETAGRQLLRSWVRSGLARHGTRHDDLAADATSRISPYLHLGCVSPLELAARAGNRADGESFIRQLCWRDFHHQVAAAFGAIATRDYRERGDRWRHSRRELEAWQGGLTGFPIVDAGMRQLLREGWMPNRARLITASFLAKDLYLDWRLGERSLLPLAGRWRHRQQRRQLAVGRRHGQRHPAPASAQPDPSGRTLRPERRLRAPLHTGAGRDRGSCGASAVGATAGPASSDRLPRSDRRPRGGSPSLPGRTRGTVRESPVVIIGAGLGGLSAACHLAGRGYPVTVVEAAATPGGRAGSIERDGYRFDTGPTVVTMPQLIARCFAAVGVDMATALPLRRVDPMYRACFADGSELRIRHGREEMADEIAAVCGAREAASFNRFTGWLTDLYELEMPNFIARNYDSPLDLVRPLWPVIELLRLGGLRRLATKVGQFFDDERLRRVFSFQSLYAGLAPLEALAVYAVITYMDTVSGCRHAAGWCPRPAAALAAAAERAGVTFRYGCRAERIVLAGGGAGEVRGVRLAGGEEISTDTVVCNADLPVAYRTLVPDLPAPRVSRRGRFSPSAVVWHAGVEGPLAPGTAHHNIHFGGQWDEAFRAVIHDGCLMGDPSLLVTVPTVDEPADAPDGRHVLYVLEPVPNLDGRVRWGAQRARVQASLTAAVARLGYPSRVEVEHFVDPRDWAAQGMERGTPFGLAHRFLQSGPFRPANVNRRAPGLVFVGSNTVPGVGIPMVILSGELAADRVVRHRTHR